MASLEGVLANIPGLSGYLAQNQYNQQHGAGQLQQIGVLSQLQERLRSQQQEQALREVLSQTGGDLEKALPALISSGHIKGAEQLAPLLKLQQEKQQKEQAIHGLKDLYQPAPPNEVLGDTDQTTVPDKKEARKQQLQKMSLLYAGNPALQGAIQREIDKLDKEDNPLIEHNFPIGGNKVQPHISYDKGKTWQPIPGSQASDKFNPSTVASDEDVEANAKAIAEYRRPPYTGYAARSPGAQKTMRRVEELNPQYNAQNYVISQKTRNAFANGVEGRTTRSFNVAIDHLDTLQDAADALQNNDIKRFNQLKQRIAEETGSQVPTDFNAIKGVVAKEIVKSVVGNATAGGVTERQELERELSRANSPQQLKGMIRRYQELMAGQLKGLKKQYESGFGGDNFEKQFLLPRSQEIYKNITESQGAPKGEGKVKFLGFE